MQESHYLTKRVKQLISEKKETDIKIELIVADSNRKSQTIQSLSDSNQEKHAKILELNYQIQLHEQEDLSRQKQIEASAKIVSELKRELAMTQKNYTDLQRSLSQANTSVNDQNQAFEYRINCPIINAQKDQSTRYSEQVRQLELERDNQKSKLQQLRQSVERLEQSN